MNTVTLRQDAYAKAQRFAKKQNISIDDYVNNLVLNMVMTQPNEAVDEPERDYYTLDELCGMFRTGKTDEELMDEYLDEMYGV